MDRRGVVQEIERLSETEENNAATARITAEPQTMATTRDRLRPHAALT
jgi:hypothetical protein